MYFYFNRLHPFQGEHHGNRYFIAARNRRQRGGFSPSGGILYREASLAFAWASHSTVEREARKRREAE